MPLLYLYLLLTSYTCIGRLGPSGQIRGSVTNPEISNKGGGNTSAPSLFVANAQN